ncbi:hypothetical protein C8R43DRAFT_1012913 [Mycena crocata]|nr:hypothetical protein C8R43DRAFT_1012913 [Mycena crocata]
MSLPSRPVSPPASKQSPTKSRTIFRKLTTKFNRNRSTSPSRRRSPTTPNNNNTTTASRELAAREARNAALRERGLLPPLPLSVQEHQQDMRIAIVASPEPGEQSGLDRRPTAANRIKEEWEAKNRERLSEFRFGGNSPAASPMEENFPAHGLEAVKEVDTPLPSPLPSPDTQELPSESVQEADMEPKAPRAPPPTLNLSRGQHLSPPLMQAWSDTPPDPYLLPLPPSPGPRSAPDNNYAALISAFSTTPPSDAQFTPISPSFLPLPPSPSISSATCPSIALSGTETPRVLGDATPRMPTSPTAASMDESSLSPPRSSSIPRLEGSESESSLNVPSLLLDSESQTTVSTSDSFGSFGRMRNVPLASKVRNSTIEPQAHHAISVIVESPSEERDGPILTSSPVDDKPLAKTLPVVVDEPPRRRGTEPPPPAAAAKADRRKSLNVFKRNKGEGLSTMTSIRRSMGMGRAKSTAGPPTGFDPSHLPPSPTLSAGFARQQQQQQPVARGRLAAAGAGHAHRLSVSPTMHSRGSILHEASKIEDEESRRMTELAFM